MCGIAGKVRYDGEPVAEPLVQRMCRAMVHRGPDSYGAFVREGVGLGAQRLRVIDLQTGDQPIRNEDGSVIVVLNGEIFNFRELRARLQKSGHAFTTGTDTEVIAHLYEEEGPGCVASLHGMFAFAVWDAPRRRLMLARDRTGEKPLFYAHRGAALSFGSELNALMQDRAIPRDLDERALDEYLAYGWIPEPRSAFAAVRKLAPASTLLFDGGEPQIDRYWRLDYARKLAVDRAEDLHEPIRAALRRAVSRRMVADVPIGAFLSGGIDSSAIVAAMAEVSPQPVKTFSIGFDSAAHDELAHARAVARRLGTDHHELVVRPDAVRIIPEMVHRYGEPFGEPSALPMFHLARLARPHVTVALSGDGGDESFAGYPRYATNALLARLDRLPRAARRGAAAAARRLPEGATLG
ncbi:MAG: asparagine synthase (glutamine-hydrolyzing), partial [Solirubrobacteraceae bacterium]|nr:asparagine synthase (glutamine-hydrolyzing) [Solirubrobacteraceae bacterium]